MAKKTWNQKLTTNNGLPKIEEAPEVWGGGTMIIPSPMMVYEAMQLIPEGFVISKNHIRKYLAKSHDCSIACPMTTGIFSNIAAHAAEENIAQGKPDQTPWWRVTKDKGELNEKFPGGIERQKELLEKEGFEIIPKGKKLFVKDFEKHTSEII
jgi:alkylated DNA nucleotide flippase Atl1